MNSPPPPPPPLSPPPPPLSSAARAEAFKSTSLQNEAEKKKPFIKSPLAYFMAVVAGAIVAPTGLILSPIVLLLSNLKGEYTTKNGQKVTPLATWIGTGVVLTPLCWVANQMMFSKPGPPKEATAQIKQFPVQPVLPSLRQQVKEVFPSREILIAYRTAWEQEFGVGANADDAAVWLSRCSIPEEDTSSANDNPRPTIVTRFLTYPSKGVRIILVPQASVSSNPPYFSWSMLFINDSNTNQWITLEEALRRMGDSCRRG